MIEILLLRSLQQQIFSWRRRRCCATCGKDKVGPVRDDGQGRDVEMLWWVSCAGIVGRSTHGHMWDQDTMDWSTHVNVRLWDGPHMWDHGMVHPWSHVCPGQREQDTHWASPCAPTWLLAPHVTRVPDWARDNDQCYSLTRVTSAEHARYTRNNRPTQMDSSSTGWFSWHCFSFWGNGSGIRIERLAFNFSPGERILCPRKE